MQTKVYVVSEPSLVDFIMNNDIEGFKTYLNESKENEDYILFCDPEYFETEAEALAFCCGIGYDSDERATPERFPLRSCEQDDLPFIEAIENYWEVIFDFSVQDLDSLAH